MNNHKINIYDILEGGSFTENNYDLNPIYETYDDFQAADPELFQKLYDLDFYSSNLEKVPYAKWSRQKVVPTQNETAQNETKRKVIYKDGNKTYLKFRIIYSDKINDLFKLKDDKSKDLFPNYTKSNKLSLIQSNGQSYDVYNINYFNSFQLKKISSIKSPNEIQSLPEPQYKSIEIYLLYTELNYPNKTKIELLYINIKKPYILNIIQSSFGSFYYLVFNNIKLQIAAADVHYVKSSYNYDNDNNNYIIINNKILENYIYLKIINVKDIAVYDEASKLQAEQEPGVDYVEDKTN